MARRRAGLAASSLCSRTLSAFVCSIPEPATCYANISARHAVAIASKTNEDRPRRTPLGIVQLLARAAQAGPHIGEFAEALYQRQSEAAVRRIQGLLSFIRKYGAARVDNACAAAVELEAYDYRFVRRYLERTSDPPASLRQVDPLIRQLTLYRDLIEQRTQQTNQEQHS